MRSERSGAGEAGPGTDIVWPRLSLPGGWRASGGSREEVLKGPSGCYAGSRLWGSKVEAGKPVSRYHSVQAKKRVMFKYIFF